MAPNEADNGHNTDDHNQERCPYSKDRKDCILPQVSLSFALADALPA